MRNARKESERRSGGETRNLSGETKRRLNDQTQKRQLESFDTTRINKRVTKPSDSGRIHAIKESENEETRSIGRET